MHRGTAPNHIHIFNRLINSDSGTFSRHGTFTPSLDKVSANDRPLYTQIGSNACIFKRDWFQTLQPRFPSLLSNFSSGTSRVLVESSRSPAPATWVTDSPWDEPTSTTASTLSSVLTDKIFFSFKLKHVAIRLSNYHMVYIRTLSLTLILSNFDEFVYQQEHQHDISRIRWGAELKICSFHSSLPCLV